MNTQYKAFYGPHPQLVIPESFDLCFSYEEQVAYLAHHVQELEKRVKILENKGLTE